MNFARTNLSLLLARQCNSTSRHTPAGNLRQRILPATTGSCVGREPVPAASAAPARTELIGAGVTMLLFLVLALFG